MREGVNPEKFKNLKNNKFFHRVIVPVYIPNDSNSFYSESIKVFEQCLSSLIASISTQTTAITIIDNNSSKKLIYPILEKYRNSIDKVVSYNVNKGKVYGVISEAKSSYEEFLTIADADIIFFPGWENAVFRIFNSFKKAGVVSPIPAQSLAFNHNCSAFLDNYLSSKIKYGKVVSDDDCEMFIRGLGNTSALNRSNRAYSWKEKQYYLKSKGEIAVVGCGHYVSTYRRDLIIRNNNFPERVFENGFENHYLDSPADQYDFYRLSTNNSFAYHMGNKYEKLEEFDYSNFFGLSDKLIKSVKLQKLRSTKKVTWALRKIIFKIMKRTLQF